MAARLLQMGRCSGGAQPVTLWLVPTNIKKIANHTINAPLSGTSPKGGTGKREKPKKKPK